MACYSASKAQYICEPIRVISSIHLNDVDPRCWSYSTLRLTSCAGECEAEEGIHRRKRRQSGVGTGTLAGAVQRPSSKATLPPVTGGAPRRSARAAPLPKTEAEVGSLILLVKCLPYRCPVPVVIHF